MTSSAKRLVFAAAAGALALLLVQRVAAQPAVADIVAAQIAERWSVAASDVQLDFGRAAADVAALPADATCRLAGRGADGYFVCVFHAGAAHDVAVRVRAGVTESAPVAAHALRAGTILTDGDIVSAASTHWGPPRGGDGAAPRSGWTLRRALAAGDAVRDTDAVPPAAVQQGQTVRVLWERGDVHLEWSGVALNGAPRGGRVRTRVDGRSAALEGIADAAGVVHLTGSQP